MGVTLRHPELCDDRVPMSSIAAQLPESVFTIADALELPIMREGVPEVLAGAEQLSRPIRWVHSGEFPDMPAVLKGGELLLTHGMSIHTQQARRRRYVADLARAGLAGLILELGSPIRRIPVEVVDEARRQQLPLIVLHRPIPWIEVTEIVHRTIVSRQDALIAHGQELHDRFAAILIGGGGVAEVLQALADMVENPVVLSREGELIYAAARGLDDDVLASGWESAARELPGAPAVLTARVAAAGDAEWGIVTAVGLQRALDHLDAVALQRAVPMLALAFLRADEEHLLTARARGEFLDALINPDAPLAEHRAHRRAGAVGFATRSSWLLPAAADLAAGHGRMDERRWSLVARDVRRELNSRSIPVVIGTPTRHRHLALAAGLANPEHRATTGEILAEALDSALRRVGSDATIVLCVGPLAASWRELGPALRETVGAVPAMRHAPPRAWHDVSRPDLRRLLWALREDPNLVEFVQSVLAPLQEADAQRGQLLQTLEALCAHGGRKADTARALHLTRQSLYKRLARLESVLGVDLGEEDQLLGLHLALRARRLACGIVANPRS